MKKPVPSGKKPPEVYGEQGHVLTPAPVKIDLRDVSAIRREMAGVYRDMRAGRIETQDGTRLVYVLEVLRKALAEEKQQSASEAGEATEVRVIRESPLILEQSE